jgi:hypothetical protein
MMQAFCDGCTCVLGSVCRDPSFSRLSDDQSVGIGVLSSGTVRMIPRLHAIRWSQWIGLQFWMACLDSAPDERADREPCDFHMTMTRQLG